MKQKQDAVLVGRPTFYIYTRKHIGAVSYEELTKKITLENLITNVGRDSILQFWGNTGAGGFPNQIGIGNSDAFPTDYTVTALQGASTFFATVSGRVYTASNRTFYISINVDYSQALFAWKESGVKDNLGILISRVVIPVIDQFTKTTDNRIIVEWQFTIPNGT